MLILECWWILLYVAVTHTEGESAEIRLESIVQAERLEAVFECRYRGAVAYSWVINGSEHVNFQSYTTPSQSEYQALTSRLTIPAIPMYNNTLVQCKAFGNSEVSDSIYRVASNNASLQVQGPILAVHNILLKSSSSSIDLSWSAPFSLNLTVSEPNIQYCINVFNVTRGGDNLFASKCNITATSYTFPINDPNLVLNFTVMPKSNVEGSLNGTTSEPVQGYLIFKPIKVPLNTNDVIIRASSYDRILFQLSFLKNVLETSPGKVPTEYIVEFLCDELVPRNCSTEKTITEDVVELVLTDDCVIERHHIYKITVYSQNVMGYSKSDSLTISTHDVELMEVTYINQIDISCSYLEGSMDHGYFVVALTFDALPDYRVAYRNELESTTNISIPSGKNYSRIIVYDLKQKTGYPEERLAGSSAVTIPSFAASQAGSIRPHAVLHDVDIATSGERICISCLLFPVDLIGCVGVIHSHSAQLENLTLTILPVNGSAIKMCTASMTKGAYLVAVFGILESGFEVVPACVTGVNVEESAMPMSPEGNVLVVQVTVGVLVITVLVITVVVIVILRNFIRKKRSYKIELLEQNQYDVPSLSRLHLSQLQSGSTEQHVFSQEESTNLSLGESSLQEPAYDVVRKDQSPHSEANTQQRSYMYASIDIDAARDRRHPSEDLTLVQYSCIDTKKFIPQIESAESLPEVPLALTAETVLSEIYAVAGKWEKLGEALGIAEHHLDLFSMEAHEHLRLHDMIHYYFSCSRCSWEDIVRSLQTIGEMEIADKIIRTGKCQVTGDLSTSNREETLPPLPPKKPTKSKFSQPSSESGNGDSVVVVDFFTDLSTLSKKSESAEPERQLQLLEVCMLENLTYQSFTVPRQVTNLCETEKEQPRHKGFLTSYFSTMIISLDLYDKFDVPLSKARAIINLTCARKNNFNELVQTRMQELARMDIMNVSTENKISNTDGLISNSTSFHKEPACKA